MRREAKETDTCLEQRQGSFHGHARRWVACVPKISQFLERKLQSIFKGKVREGHSWLLQTSWCGNPLFLQLLAVGLVTCSYKLPTRPMLLSSATFYLFVNGIVLYFKGQSLENGLPCRVQAIGNILNLFFYHS